ncbi:hypothetical protein GALMADRAFT_237851 [Galerina marginata CBS 339.88]|uniref:DUF6534 domain-containing protein n=1 Tax=Galerina marginata (strain CBS 339.88) TaxID=685588 RepID=A0A067TH41_GALM3|nr:hypothetical protein GALMADRAFT_237851 [Galerina marginata CBS 339.88]
MGLSLDNTLGAASIGFSVSCVVFGVLTTQLFVYFQRFPSDRIVYKLLVAALWSLELIDQTFIAYSLYFYTITNFNDPLYLLTGRVIWTLILFIVMTSLVGTVVKCCFAMRVWRFSKRNIYITGVIIFMILGQFGIAILYCIRAFRLKTLLEVHQLRLVASLALGAGLLTDFLIAAALCFFLRRLRTGYHKSDTLINSLCRYAVNTGALTGVVSFLTLLLYNVRPEAFYFMATYFTLGKLYAISFLCALNTRKVIRGKGTDREGNTSDTSNMRNTFLMVTNNSRVQRNIDYATQTKSMEIDVRQEVSISRDIESAIHDKTMVIVDAKIDFGK